MWLPVATVLHVLASRVVEAQAAIRTSTNNLAVMVVLSVVFPAALVADLVDPALAERQVTTARARVRSAVCWGEHVALRRVRVEPRGALRDKLFVAEARVIIWPTHHS